MQHIIYLHGFLSSPQSDKAQQTIAFAKRHYPAINVHVPQLSGDIAKAADTIERLIATLPKTPLRFIGSSMGGFLSTYFVEKYTRRQGAKAVLINPAVAPYVLLKSYMGQHTNLHSNEHFSITDRSIALLHTFDTLQLQHALDYKVLLQTLDETLDYRLAQAKYAGADMTIENGGNHSFVGYQAHLPAIFNFLR